MNNARIRWLVIVALAFAAVGSGIAAWYLGREKDKLAAALARVAVLSPEQPVKALEPSATQPPAKDDGQAAMKDLREKLVKLNRENASLKRELARMGAAPQGGASQNTPNERPQDWWQFHQQARQEYLDKLKATDPEQYEKVMKEEERRRQWMQAASQRFGSLIADQRKFLSDLDTSAMTEEQRTQHEKLINTVNKMNELSERIAATEDTNERGNLERQRFEMIRSAMEGFESARAAALTDIGRRLGYDETESRQLADYVKHVYDMTSMGRMFRGDGGGGGGGGAPR